MADSGSERLDPPGQRQSDVLAVSRALDDSSNLPPLTVAGIARILGARGHIVSSLSCVNFVDCLKLAHIDLPLRHGSQDAGFPFRRRASMLEVVDISWCYAVTSVRR